MDSVVLYGPGGASPVQIGSWLDRGQGDPDYGARGLLHAIEAESFGDGGQFVYDRAPIRHMNFPLIVGSGAGLGLSLVQIESLLRLNARPGGFIDVQPEGVASSEAVRFDIVYGRWEPNYSIFHNRLPRRQGSLALDTQPFGYWPTWITLASVASMALPGVLSVPVGSLPGDVPGLVELVALATGASSGGASPTYMVDAFAYGNSGRPSFAAAFAGGSWVTAGTVIGDPFALGSQAAGIPYSAAASGWSLKLSYPIPSALEPAYRGRFRAFALFAGHASVPFQVSLDGALDTLVALASSAPIATVAPTAGSYHAWLDLGDVTLPPVGSGVQQQERLRLWVNPASIGASSMLLFGGLQLLPLDGQAGVMPRGLARPTIGIAHASQTIGGFRIAPDVGAAVWSASQPIANALIHYRGVQPRLGASVIQFDLVGMQRLASVASGAYPDMIRADATLRAQASVRGRPQFQFLKGL